VAGIGNIFFSDDGFGPEVVRRLVPEPDPGVRVVDYGIRGMHLAYDLLDHDGSLVIVDAVPGPGEPGTIRVLEVGPDDLGDGELDAHGMNPVAVLANLEVLGGTLPTTYVVGCVPASVEEGMGLSAPVAAAVDAGVVAVRDLLADLRLEAQGMSPKSWRRRTPPRSRAGGVADPSKTSSLRACRRLTSPRLDDAGIHLNLGDTP
jgi:hydrogenase maturation protease